MNRRNAHTGRAPRPRAPDLRTLEHLDQTHHEIIEVLARLHLLIEKLDVRGTDEGVRRLALDVCTFLDQTAGPHHTAEERFLFPDLLASGDVELIQNVRRLQQDHGWLEEDWHELGPHLRAVANGKSWYDIDLLREAVPVFCELYRDHIALEESVVYPAARHRRAERRQDSTEPTHEAT